MKYIRYVLVALVLLLITTQVCAINVDDKIYDNANLLTNQERQSLKTSVDQFIEKYNMDMVLLTVTNGYNIENQAKSFYLNNGFGIGIHSDGVILALAIDSQGEIDYSFLTRGEAIRVFDDARIDSIVSSMSRAKYGGAGKIFEAFVGSASSYASQGVAHSNRNTYICENGELCLKRQFPWVVNIIISLGVATIVVVVLVLKNKMIRKSTKACEYVDKDSIKFTRQEDRFISTNTTRVRVPRNNGGSSAGGSSSRGGGFGGKSGRL